MKYGKIERKLELLVFYPISWLDMDFLELPFPIETMGI